jgi:hypothetical protein
VLQDVVVQHVREPLALPLAGFKRLAGEPATLQRQQPQLGVRRLARDRRSQPFAIVRTMYTSGAANLRRRCSSTWG